MEIIILPTPAEVCDLAARKVAQLLHEKPTAVLGLATGSSPLAIYAALADRVRAGSLNVDGVRCFALDEYVGIPEVHPESYVSVIRREVVERIGLDPAKVSVPDGRAEDLMAVCRAYEEAIAEAGGIDLQILGLGSNGHIGFNEPTSSFGSRTRIKTLTPQTRADNARFFDDPNLVPTHCLTQGMGTIMDARKVVLVAQGEAKAEAVAAMVEGPVASVCPGSLLQFHPSVSIIIDEAAATGLQLSEYYRFTYDNLPSWERF